MLWLIVAGLALFLYLGSEVVNELKGLRVRLEGLSEAVWRVRDELAEMNKTNKNSS